MHFYPAYKYEDVLEMCAFHFFTLINESHKIDASIRLDDINTATIPYVDRETASEIIGSYQRTATDILDIIDEEPSSTEEIRQALGGR